MLTFEVCTMDIDRLFDEIEPLLKYHWCEVERDMTIDLDRPFYRMIYAQKRYVGILAKCAGKVIGYNSFFLKCDPHNKEFRIATNDVYFIAPEHRNLVTSARLMREADAYLKTLGINLVRYGTKKKRDASKFLRFLGYEEMSTTYEKVLR